MSNELQRILYLEDDASIAELAIMGLEDSGKLEIQHCICGADAIRAAAVFRPQLCLFDVMLPDMDGLQTLQAIRSTDENRDVAVIFMTAKAQIHQQKAYLAAGALGVIVKPFNPITLPDEIIALWKARRETI